LGKGLVFVSLVHWPIGLLNHQYYDPLGAPKSCKKCSNITARDHKNTDNEFQKQIFEIFMNKSRNIFGISRFDKMVNGAVEYSRFFSDIINNSYCSRYLSPKMKLTLEDFVALSIT
jgi:hypothetical protein